MALTRSSKRFLVFLTLLLGVIGGGILSGIWWIDEQLQGVEEGAGEPVPLEIASGSTASDVANQLEEAGVIRNATVFRFTASNRGLDANIQAGEYEFETGMSVDEVIEVLNAGPRQAGVYRVTVPEGLTVSQTLDRLAEATPHDRQTYRDILDAERANPGEGPLDVPGWVPAFGDLPPEAEVFEGLLFPETYEFSEEASATDVLQRLLDQTATVMDSMPAADLQAAEQAGISRYDALIIASLIEREARVGDERPLIASVIRNRLAAGMLLQVDATLLYAAGAPEGGPGVIDTEIDSPYNTYQNTGLPPTPIAGARAAAIQAAIDPEESDFLFYVVSPECDGSHRFATTFDEHAANAEAYRAAGCEQ